MNESITLIEKRQKAEFTEKQMRDIYAFLDQYIPDGPDKVKAKREILSMMRYDRYIFKHRLESAIHKVM